MSFDVLAPHYRWMEWVLAGEKLQRCRLEHLDALRSAQRILVLGEGHGRFVSQVAVRFPTIQIHCVESSGKMIFQARRALEREGVECSRVVFEQVDARSRSWEPGSFDAVVTHFFLDCFPVAQLERLIPRVAEVLREGGVWLVSDFDLPPRGLARLRARWVLFLAYRFFRCVTRLPAGQLALPDPILKSAGLRLVSGRRFDWGLLRSDLWAKESSSIRSAERNSVFQVKERDIEPKPIKVELE